MGKEKNNKKSTKQQNTPDEKISVFDDFFAKYYEEESPVKKIELCITYIQEKLSAGAISLMVGAGFSKNADSEYPDWAELLIDAYLEMDQKIKKKFEANVICKECLKDMIKDEGESDVASRYEKFKGYREALDLYIENQFSTKLTRAPSLEIHEALLHLNWCDVITTNWDDLLEKSSAKLKYFYRTVKRAKDLRVSNKRRIIKLHGSIREEADIKNSNYLFDDSYSHLYVITTNDFDSYKNEHEDFSNFMKVKILETPFCLMGFSGRDLNFRYWIKELKRTMLKGGNTENPNPIFLFDINPDPIHENDIEYEKSLDLFYSNNYIIRIRVLDLYNSMNSSQPINSTVSSSNIQQNSNVLPNLSHKDLNSFIVDKLSEKISETKNSTSEETVYLNTNTEEIKDSTLDVIYNIAGSNNESLSIEDITQYNALYLFSIANLETSFLFGSKVKKLGHQLNSLTEKYFIFLYKWCLSNFYSLSNVFETNIIDNIIKKYIDEKLYVTDAYIFAELILQYYRENDMKDKFTALCKNEFKTKKLKNIIIYQKALNLITDLKYEQLKKIIENWTPENDEAPNSLFILRKISLIFAFENMRFYSDKKDFINSLFQKAVTFCTEKQLQYFILLFHKSYSFCVDFTAPFEDQDKINALQLEGLKPISEFINHFNFKPKMDQLVPNQQKRYSGSTISFGESKNSDFINVLRYFNFFEFIGLPLLIVTSKQDLQNMIPRVKIYDYLLHTLFFHSLSYFGNDSAEDTLITIVPNILRYFNDQRIINDYLISFFKILKYKINNLQNAKVYVYLVTEIAKYAKKEAAQEFYHFICTEIIKPSDVNEQIKQGISRGSMWGLKTPFLYIIKQLIDKDLFSQLLIWTMQEHIEDEKKLSKSNPYQKSEFFSYYFELMKREDMKDIITNIFMQDKGKELIQLDMKLKGTLSLYGYQYVGKEIKLQVLKKYIQIFSIDTDPYFITIFKSEEIKETVLQAIEKKEILSSSSREYPIGNFIRALHQVELLNTSDKKRIAEILLKNLKRINNNLVYFNHSFISKLDILQSFFIALETITTDTEKKMIPEITDSYEVIKSELKTELTDFYTFTWLYTNSLQDFRSNFIRALTLFSYFKEVNQYLHIINMALTKVIMQDDANFEGVIEQFISVYCIYEDGILINEATNNILFQMMKKFHLEIPFCYDDLFIKEQMKKLAEQMKKNKIENEILDYWIAQ
ncbi:MAG: SIR2 family protein [Treponemataceae bacterium]